MNDLALHHLGSFNAPDMSGEDTQDQHEGKGERSEVQWAPTEIAPRGLIR